MSAPPAAAVEYLIANGAYFLQGENGWGEKSCATRFASEKERRAKLYALRKSGFENATAYDIEKMAHRVE